MNKLLIGLGVLAVATLGTAVAINIFVKKARAKKEEDESRDLTCCEIFCEECDGNCKDCLCKGCADDEPVESFESTDIPGEEA